MIDSLEDGTNTSRLSPLQLGYTLVHETTKPKSFKFAASTNLQTYILEEKKIDLAVQHSSALLIFESVFAYLFISWYIKNSH